METETSILVLLRASLSKCKMAKKKKPVPKGKSGAYSSRQLTQHLRELASDIHEMDEGGELFTKGQALAKLVFDKALGHEEKQIDDDGKEKMVYHKPEAWAIQLIWERMEGKAPQATPDDKKTLTAASKVGDLVKARINSLSEAAAALPDSSGPVDLPQDGAEGSKGPDQESGMAGKTPKSG